MGVLEGCLIVEELAYGCSGIKTAIEGSSLGVSTLLLIQITNCLCSGVDVMFMQTAKCPSLVVQLSVLACVMMQF